MLGDKAYDSAELRLWLAHRGTKPVIPNRSNRKQPFSFNKRRYKERHLIENAFSRLKDFMFASDEPGNPGRQMERTLGTDDIRKRGQPIPDLGGIIVHNVVDASGLAVFESLNGRCRGVIDVNKRPPARAIANQRRSSIADLCEHSALKHAGAGPVEGSVTQYDTFRISPS